MPTFPQRLKELRQNKNMLQKDIAKLLNISVRQYSSYESEKQNVDVPMSKLLLLADYFEVSLDYLTGRCNTPIPLKIKQQAQRPITALKVARSKSSTSSSSPITTIAGDFSDLLNATPVTNDDDL